uniref:JAZF zinc finger 1 n=1 Tax=Moschus moschiferus TaxID=68415 RepID=A0A8C6D7L0_MOSMO
MTGIAAASFFSNTCRFGGCGLHFPTLADLIEHIEDNHIAPPRRDESGSCGSADPSTCGRCGRRPRVVLCGLDGEGTAWCPNGAV